MNFPVPGTGPGGWQQVAASGSEWRDLRRKWGSRQDMNESQGVGRVDQEDKVEVSADELRNLRKELKELKDLVSSGAQREHSPDSSGSESAKPWRQRGGRGNGDSWAGDEASGWYSARGAPSRRERNPNGRVSSAGERTRKPERTAWAPADAWREDRQKGWASADWSEDATWASARWREDRAWATGRDRREYRQKAWAWAPSDRRDKPWASAERREERLGDHRGAKARNRLPGRKPAPAQKSVRIRIDGLYGLHKNEVMTVEDADDCEGTILILSGCWKFFAVPKEDEGVGWEYVDSPPTCINPGNCAKHRGMKYSLITDYDCTEDESCKPCA